MYFPITCVDNFFDNPDEVRKLALSLDFNTKEGRYPGVRTQELHEVAPDYFHYFCRKLFGLFYNIDEVELSWVVKTCFQMIEPFKEDGTNFGWVHKDQSNLFAGIIYLTPDADLNSGTSIFKPKKLGFDPINTDQKIKLYTDHVVTEEIKKSLKESNDRYVETVDFKNIYNRFVCWGGNEFHAANSFYTGNEPRLTQVFFAKKVVTNWFPVPSSRTG
jgi:hypothetical protein